jgi:hypothetical protein
MNPAEATQPPKEKPNITPAEKWPIHPDKATPKLKPKTKAKSVVAPSRSSSPVSSEPNCLGRDDKNHGHHQRRKDHIKVGGSHGQLARVAMRRRSKGTRCPIGRPTWPHDINTLLASKKVSLERQPHAGIFRDRLSSPSKERQGGAHHQVPKISTQRHLLVGSARKGVHGG